MAKKEAKQRFILNLNLKTEKFEEKILDKRFEIGRKIYNSILGKALNRYNEMSKTIKWRNNQSELSNIYKSKCDKKELNKLCAPCFYIKNEMLKEFRLTEYSLHEDVKSMQHTFKDNMDSFTAQKVASRVWKALETNLFSKGEQVHFKGQNNPVNSLEGKSNGTGIRYDMVTNTFKWIGLEIETMLNINNQYEIDALKNRICFCRVKRKFVRGKYKYILQIVLDGVVPVKLNKETGEIKNYIGSGNCGIDIGTQTVAYVSNYHVKLYELAPRVQNIENKKRRIQRFLDRSKRSTNPNNFNEDGMIKKGAKLEWKYSKKYVKAKYRLKDIYRKQKDIREQDHNVMTNEIVKKCNVVYVEQMNFKGLQKRVKNTTINEKTGKINKKKRYGKSLANKSPSKFLEILYNKLKVKGGKYIEINTRQVKASQYNHLDQEYKKKKLSQRWNYFEYNGKQIKVQRDIYSAYLIKNVSEDLCSIHLDNCSKGFDKFLELHNREIVRLQGLENLSSVGV
ncbi:transposase [Clostridium estertheticum]|uniref:transposase n=1 Tax=Clostridium estertheticum TaxID=238834 RepID=UPI0013E8F709|nr:transposase [Clostridium estertheticum]MBZ9686738.1 transposase [Clostridium estertheticum]